MPVRRLSKAIYKGFRGAVHTLKNKNSFVFETVVFPPLNIIPRIWKHHRSIPHEILRKILLLGQFPVSFLKKLQVTPFPLTWLEI